MKYVIPILCTNHIDIRRNLFMCIYKTFWAIKIQLYILKPTQSWIYPIIWWNTNFVIYSGKHDEIGNEILGQLVKQNIYLWLPDTPSPFVLGIRTGSNIVKPWQCHEQRQTGIQKQINKEVKWMIRYRIHQNK